MSASNFPCPSLFELTSVSARVGLLSFGGPAGQIALMHREFVDERGWVNEHDYLQALNLCHLLPGPEAQQLASWIGWRLHGWRGGLIAGGLFVLPGAMVMLALSVIYALAANLAWFESLFLGIKAAVLAIIAQALARIARRAVVTVFQRTVAVAAFLALFLFNLPFPILILVALGLGAVVGAMRPEWLALGSVVPRGELSPRPWQATIRAVLVWVAIWAAPLIAVGLFLGRDHVLWDIGLFFSQLAVVTFGGAYAVLAYMAQEAVTGFGWLAAGEMADGLGLAETTPGPLIMVTQFVGYLAAYRAPEPFTPLVAGTLGAALTTWVTFAPCFLWIFAFAPWIERLHRARPLRGGLAAVTAAVVGVIANLAVWFAMHTLFSHVAVLSVGPVRLQLPDFAAFQWPAGLIALLAFALLFGMRFGIVSTLAAAAAAGLIFNIAS